MKMKSIVVAAALVVFSAMSMATEVGVAYERGHNATGPRVNYDLVEVNASQAIGKTGFDITGKVTGARNDAKTNDLSAAIGAQYSVMEGVYVKGGLGREFDNGASNYNFYTFGGGASMKFMQVRLLADVERQNAFKAPNPHFTAYKAGVGYDIAKNQTVEVKYVRRLGDTDTKGVEAGYNIRF